MKTKYIVRGFGVILPLPDTGRSMRTQILDLYPLNGYVIISEKITYTFLIYYDNCQPEKQMLHSLVQMNDVEGEKVKAACALFPCTNKRALYRAFLVLGAAYAIKRAAADNPIPIGAIFDAEGNATPENVLDINLAQQPQQPEPGRKKSK